jgi:hypothetical protein
MSEAAGKFLTAKAAPGDARFPTRSEKQAAGKISRAPRKLACGFEHSRTLRNLPDHLLLFAIAWLETLSSPQAGIAGREGEGQMSEAAGKFLTANAAPGNTRIPTRSEGMSPENLCRKLIDSFTRVCYPFTKVTSG